MVLSMQANWKCGSADQSRYRPILFYVPVFPSNCWPCIVGVLGKGMSREVL